MDTVEMTCLGIIICAALSCNIVALVFNLRKRTESTIKERTIIVLCAINVLQTLVYCMEMYSMYSGNETLQSCQVASLLMCSFTYSSVGYYVVVALERYVTASYLTDFTDYLSNTLWLIVPPVCGFSLGSAPMLGWGRYGKLHKTSSYCTLNFTDPVDRSSTYYLVIFTVMFAVPVSISCFCLLHIFVQLYRRLTSTHNQNNDQKKVKKKKMRRHHSKEESAHQIITSSEQVMMNFHMTGFVYFIFWLPYTVVCFMLYCDVEVASTYEYTAIYLAKSAIIAAPMFYCFIGSHLITGIMRFFQKVFEATERGADELNVGVLKIGLGLIVPPVNNIESATVEDTPLV